MKDNRDGFNGPDWVVVAIIMGILLLGTLLIVIE